MHASCDPGAKLTAERHLHSLKQLKPRACTLRRIQIDERENAQFPITRSLESGSKVTVETELHPAKQKEPMDVTGERMRIDRSD
jgi:hypothetical protein